MPGRRTGDPAECGASHPRHQPEAPPVGYATDPDRAGSAPALSIRAADSEAHDL